jgi:FixJ family two-component response regulator
MEDDMRVDQSLSRRRAPTLANETDAQPLIAIVDDDKSVRTALSELIESAGFTATCFGSTQELLDASAHDWPGCLILDVRMPGVSGLELQNQLARNGNLKPIIFLTGHGDIPMTVQAMKAGAVDFLTKPVRDQTLLDAVIAAIALDAARRAEAIVVARNCESVKSLTNREHEVLREVVKGRLNKQVAFDLGISEGTVKLHRSNGMRKMKASTIGELIRAWETLPEVMR